MGSHCSSPSNSFKAAEKAFAERSGSRLANTEREVRPFTTAEHISQSGPSNCLSGLGIACSSEGQDVAQVIAKQNVELMRELQSLRADMALQRADIAELKHDMLARAMRDKRASATKQAKGLFDKCVLEILPLPEEGGRASRLSDSPLLQRPVLFNDNGKVA